MKRSCHRRLHVSFVLLGVLIGLAGCRSQAVGGRDPRKDEADPRDLKGFPFALTKPEFVLTRDEKGIDALAVTWVPDLAHVYTIRNAPGEIADSKFMLELDENGSLRSLSTSSTENVTPTLKVIGQVAAATIGLKSALPEADAVRTSIATLDPDEFELWVADLKGESLATADARREAVEALEKDIERLQTQDAIAGKDVPSAEIAVQQRKWAVAIGAYEEWELEQKLVDLLRQGVRPSLGERPQAEAVRDFDRARLQLVEVRKAMTEKRSKLTKPLPKPERLPKNEPIREISLQDVAKAANLTTAELRNALDTNADQGGPSSPLILAALKSMRRSERFLVIKQKRPAE